MSKTMVIHHVNVEVKEDDIENPGGFILRNIPAWAWCTVGDSPGYEDISYTRNDGMTPIDVPDEHVQLGPVLFQVQIDE